LIGVSDEGTIIGIDIGRNTLEELVNYIKRNTDPAIFPSVKILDVEGKKIIVIEVKDSAEKPVFFKNHAYKRVSKTTQMVSSSEMRKLAKESGERVYWDERICEEAKVEDIDEEKIRWLLRRARYERRLEISPDISVREALERLNLIKNNKLTSAAILLFGKEPQKFFLQTKLRCARYKGTTPITFIDLKIGMCLGEAKKTTKFHEINTRR